MSNKLTQSQKEELVALYQSGLTYKEIQQKLGYASTTIAKYVKGLRTHSEAAKLCRIKGKWKLSEEGRIALSKHAKQRCIKGNKVCTEPERIFGEILHEMGYGVKIPNILQDKMSFECDPNADFAFQYPIQRYLCDYVWVSKKIVFNIHGDFWHANPILYSENKLTKIQKFNATRDKRKTQFLEKIGYTVIDIWESEIKWNQNLVIDKIQRAGSEVAYAAALHAVSYGGSNPSPPIKEDWSKDLKKLWFKMPRPKKPKSKLKCCVCRKSFEVVPSKKDKRVTCSISCANQKLRKVERPSKIELQKLIESTPMMQIGKLYGVSDNAIRKWAKSYGL